MRAWGYTIGVREPGGNDGGCAGNYDSQTICSPYNDGGALDRVEQPALRTKCGGMSFDQ
jgi:hypothetical protein